MSLAFVRVGLMAAAMLVASTSAALAETSATPAPKTTVAQASPSADSATAPLPTPNPLTLSGFFRSYYFTRQNATNNPGVQSTFVGSKCNGSGPCVNQASLNNAVLVRANYDLPYAGWYVGGSYFYAQPFNGPCSVAANHAKGLPCVSQAPPNTNPDDTLPGFAMSTFPETYVGFKNDKFAFTGGDFLFNSPWAGPFDGTRLKPVAYQGGDLSYLFDKSVTFEFADIVRFQNRTSNSFTDNTLLTSYPAGGGGLASNIYIPGGRGVNTSGFQYYKVGFTPSNQPYTINGYAYNVTDLVNMYWGDARYTWTQNQLKPYLALQGGWESNTGASYIGKIASSLIGLQGGVNVTKNVLVTAGFDSIPWHNDTINLPKGVTCSNSNYQISAKGATLGYFLPLNAAQCFTNPNGTTNVYYGGWASPYTDNYATDPIFTTSISQGIVDRRAPGSSWKLAATFTSNNKRFVLLASDAWYNYGNTLAAENTNEWNLDGSYRFSPVTKNRYHGLLLRYRYMQRSQSNTFCGAAGSSCSASATLASTYLGGLPLFKYNRAQLEYDF